MIETTNNTEAKGETMNTNQATKIMTLVAGTDYEVPVVAALAKLGTKNVGELVEVGTICLGDIRRGLRVRKIDNTADISLTMETGRAKDGVATYQAIWTRQIIDNMIAKGATLVTTI